jgi:hypothetical protein
VAVVHNGQLTNYFQWRRRLERSGHRFQSECDSEIIAVYVAERMTRATPSRRPCVQSLEELDGVFTYMCVTADALGIAKDEMAAKPLVLYESGSARGVASEGIAIGDVTVGDTYDPRGRGDGMAAVGERAVSYDGAWAGRADALARRRGRRRPDGRARRGDLSIRRSTWSCGRPRLRARRDPTSWSEPGSKHSLASGS